MPAITTIKLRRGTAAQWTSANPVLAAGEEGHESDTGLRKVGNGSTAWTSLAYHNPVPTGTYVDMTTAQTVAGNKKLTGRLDLGTNITAALAADTRTTNTATPESTWVKGNVAGSDATSPDIWRVYALNDPDCSFRITGRGHLKCSRTFTLSGSVNSLTDCPYPDFMLGVVSDEVVGAPLVYLAPNLGGLSFNEQLLLAGVDATVTRVPTFGIVAQGRMQLGGDAPAAGVRLHIKNPAGYEAFIPIRLEQAAGTGQAADLFQITNAGGSTVLSRFTQAGALEVAVGGQALTLKPGSADHAYIGLHARTATSSTRTGYIGFAVAASTNLSMTNEISNGLAEMRTTGAGSEIRMYPGGVLSVRITGTGGFNIGNTGDLGNNGSYGLGLTNTSSAPTANPAAGVVLYSESGTLKARGTSGTAFQPTAYTASDVPLIVKGFTSQTGDMTRWTDVSNVILSRIGKGGRFITKVATAPALGDLVDGETALSTDASGNLIVTSRVSGALKTATVTVA